MTYALSGLIQATDYNTFATSGVPNLNGVWSVGSNNSGYGQPALVAAQQDSVVLSSPWLNLITNIGKAAQHQGTTINGYRVSTPAVGDLIVYEPLLGANLNLISNNRLNAAAQASTTVTTATKTTSWSNTLTITFTVTFANDNSARYYFNAGGQIGFNFSHPSGTGANGTVSTLSSDAGTVWFSSPGSSPATATLSGTTYTGVTKLGGTSPTGTVVYTGNGFYSLYPSSTKTLLYQTSGGGGYYYYYYGSAYLRITANYNGAGVLTFTCLYDDIGGGSYYYYYGGSVSPGTVANLTLRPPSTAHLANTWGTPGISYTIS